MACLIGQEPRECISLNETILEGEYEKGSTLLQGFIRDMEHHKIKMSQGFRETYLAALNLDKHLADMGRYEEANEICMKWAKIAVDSGYADLLDDYLVQ